MKPRFEDTGEWLYQFTDLFLVHCPRCDRCAKVVLRDAVGEQPQDYMSMVFSPRRLVCEHCGYTQNWQGREVGSTDLSDYYFHRPLWLQTPCCNETLWALNTRHLDFLERYVAAELREGQGHGTLASKLPQWIMSAKNRDDVLKCIRRLREMARDDR